MNIKSLFLFLLAIAAISNEAVAQDSFTVQIQPLTINGAPSLHSYAWGKTTDGKWIIVGGRLDGLHQRQPFASFLENDNNKSIYVIDPVGNQTWSASISMLQASIFEQLQSTNQEFFQRGNTLYVIGGYGYSATQGDHVTYDKLTAIDVDGVANAVINNNSITSFFRQISHPDIAVTGGQLGLLDDMFYLCGGQYFEGRYNPQGPNNGPGFTQSYTDEIRTFEINDDGTNLSIINYAAQNDINNLHRRDYNMAPQIFPDGSEGFTMFSGVFQYTANIPWLNTVDVSPTGYTVNNTFNQYLSQYHSAKIPVYDASSNEMHTLFFGGLSQFKLDANGNLIQDNNVPFVKTISKVTRFSDGSMVESALDIEMPAYLGSGSEFIPVHDPTIYRNEEIVDFNNLPDGSTLVGYIYGGIESSQENIFFVNNGTQSSASNLVFEVVIVKNTLGIDETTLQPENIYNLKVYPNPSRGNFKVEVFIPNTENSTLEVYDVLGKKITSQILEASVGLQNVQLDLTQIASGEYFLIFKNAGATIEEKIIKL
jgi:hypothetical protein